VRNPSTGYKAKDRPPFAVAPCNFNMDSNADSDITTFLSPQEKLSKGTYSSFQTIWQTSQGNQDKTCQLSQPAGLKPITTWFKQTASTSKSQSDGSQ